MAKTKTTKKKEYLCPLCDFKTFDAGEMALHSVKCGNSRRPRVHCEFKGCTYSAKTAASIARHSKASHQKPEMSKCTADLQLSSSDDETSGARSEAGSEASVATSKAEGHHSESESIGEEPDVDIAEEPPQQTAIATVVSHDVTKTEEAQVPTSIKQVLIGQVQDIFKPMFTTGPTIRKPTQPQIFAGKKRDIAATSVSGNNTVEHGIVKDVCSCKQPRLVTKKIRRVEKFKEGDKEVVVVTKETYTFE